MNIKDFKFQVSLAISNDPEPVISKFFSGVQVVGAGKDYRLNPAPCCAPKDGSRGGNNCATVSPGVATINCFSCHKAGLLYDYLLEYLGVEQEQVFIKFLCETYKVDPLELELNTKEIRTQDIRKRAVEHYHEQLLNSQEELRYQQEGRKHSIETLKTLKVGLFKNFEGLKGGLIQSGFKEEEIDEANIEAKEGLIVYPYIDPNTSEIKRFNTKPALPNKDFTGYSMGSKACFTTPTISKEMVIVVEGENDLMSLVEAGITSVIALGGSPSKYQLKELERLVDSCGKVYLMMDNDLAGQRMAEKVNECLPHKHIYQIKYDEGIKDPDVLLKCADQKVDLEALIKNAELLPAEGFKIRNKGTTWKLLKRNFQMSISLRERSNKGIFSGDIKLYKGLEQIDAKANEPIAKYKAKDVVTVSESFELHQAMESYYDKEIAEKDSEELLNIFNLSLSKTAIIRRLAEIAKQNNQFNKDMELIKDRLGKAAMEKVAEEYNDILNGEVDLMKPIPKMRISQFFDPKEDLVFFYYAKLVRDDGGVMKIPYFITNRREEIRLDLVKKKNPQNLLLVKGRYQLPGELKVAPMDLEEISLKQVWAEKYCNGELARQDILMPHAIILQLEKVVKRFWYCKDDRAYKIVALWIYGTYLYELFGEYPYLFLNGNKGTGKSTLNKLIHRFAFNAKFSYDTTEAALFRKVDAEGGTMILDEMEYISNGKQVAEAGISSILKGGYARNQGSILRCSTADNGFTTEGFVAYCPKVISNINGLENVIGDRTIPIQMLETKPKELNGLEDFNDYWDNHREEIYNLTSITCLSVLEHYQMIYKAYQEEKFDGMSARVSQIMRPLSALAGLVGPEYKEALQSFYEDKMVPAKKDAEGSSPEGVLKLILKHLAEQLAEKQDHRLLEINSLNDPKSSQDVKRIPEKYTFQRINDGFEVTQIWLKIAMDYYLGYKYPFQSVHKKISQLTGAKNLPRKTVKVNDLDLAKEIGDKIFPYVYTFKFTDYLTEEPSKMEQPVIPKVSSKMLLEQVAVNTEGSSTEGWLNGSEF